MNATTPKPRIATTTPPHRRRRSTPNFTEQNVTNTDLGNAHNMTHKLTNTGLTNTHNAQNVTIAYLTNTANAHDVTNPPATIGGPSANQFKPWNDSDYFLIDHERFNETTPPNMWSTLRYEQNASGGLEDVAVHGGLCGGKPAMRCASMDMLGRRCVCRGGFSRPAGSDQPCVRKRLLFYLFFGSK